MLNQVSVLIVENEPFIALDLATAVEEARGKVIGPARSVREALMLIERHLVQAAVLDVNLSDRDVTPLLSFSLKAAFRWSFIPAWLYRSRSESTPPVQLLHEPVALMWT